MKNIKTVKLIRLSLIVLFMSIGTHFLQAQTTKYSKTVSNQIAIGDLGLMMHIIDNTKGVAIVIEGDTMKLKNQVFKITSHKTINLDETKVADYYCLSEDAFGRTTKVTIFQYTSSYYQIFIQQRDVDLDLSYTVKFWRVNKKITE